MAKEVPGESQVRPRGARGNPLDPRRIPVGPVEPPQGSWGLLKMPWVFLGRPRGLLGGGGKWTVTRR